MEIKVHEVMKMVKYAGVIAKSYADIDFNELINQTNKMAAGIGNKSGASFRTDKQPY